MNEFTTELIKTLLEGKDITEIFREHIEGTVNQHFTNITICKKTN